MCTSLVYRDAAGRAYFGRTLELTVNLPYQIAWFPTGYMMRSQIADHPPVNFTTRYGVLAIAMPERNPTKDNPIRHADLKILEGMNDHGLTFSLLSYPMAAGAEVPGPGETAVLSASDLGLWALGQFRSVAEVKAAIATQPVKLESLAILGGVVSPFHYVVNDATGASFVIEFHKGEISFYDNPVGVLTNAPRFKWHLTNLDNYTFLSNVDRATATFGNYVAAQPDSGIATTGLPASNTSVGRFVRAAFYAQYAEKATTPDKAVTTLAHMMNNFDRPRGLTIDLPENGIGHLEVKGLDRLGSGAVTEFTCWTSLSDLDRKLFFLRDYDSHNYTRFDLSALAGASKPLSLPMHCFGGDALEGTTALKAA
ncbi:linear amide C-N hydrolase [Synechococcus sp. CCY9201]|uniref:linear amide C-N hydrolase n=1 Tax=Synechococcus sp. CCY9201 TaxID=174697 RepID=UPI002B2041A3|nr:linear amide C-N hydrolase [Synechococcus sp. CCY9201]MEA5474531.1 linear amide C-N hydrolase [Synechococcus sp. CCY9201]